MLYIEFQYVTAQCFVIFDFWQTDPFLPPCPIGYNEVAGHVDKKSSTYDITATFNECEAMCTNDLKCLSFEFCGYSCDLSIGAPSFNRCMINDENFPEVPSLQNFFRCAKGK